MPALTDKFEGRVCRVTRLHSPGTHIQSRAQVNGPPRSGVQHGLLGRVQQPVRAGEVFFGDLARSHFTPPGADLLGLLVSQWDTKNKIQILFLQPKRPSVAWSLPASPDPPGTRLPVLTTLLCLRYAGLIPGKGPLHLLSPLPDCSSPNIPEIPSLRSHLKRY